MLCIAVGVVSSGRGWGGGRGDFFFLLEGPKIKFSKINVDFSEGVQRPEHEGVHSPPSSPQLKNEWSDNLIHTHALMACNTKHLLSRNYQLRM